MKNYLFILVLLLAVLLSGCGMGDFLSAPTADPNVGAGKAPVQAVTQLPAATAPVNAPAANTPAAPASEAVQPTRTLAVPTQPPASGAPGLAPGGSFQQGSLIFTLVRVQADADKTQVSFTVDGLPAGYVPAPDAGEPRIELAGGEELNTVSGGGGTVQGRLSGEYTFPALPPGANSITLVVTNNWSGPLLVWKIPIRINP